MALIRLDKYINDLGLCSRRSFKEFIKKNIITYEGERILKPDFKVDTHLKLILNGKELKYSKYIYLMMNKPDGVISATYEPRNKEKTVIDLLEEPYSNMELFPVGRLDKDTVGLLILTNDGMFSHNTLSPKKHVVKKYYAEIDQEVTVEDIKIFKEGITLDDGYLCKPAELLVQDKMSGVIIEISEGKFHQIKRMFEAVGKNVTYLKRIQFDEIYLDKSLPEGKYRELTEQELEIVKKFGGNA